MVSENNVTGNLCALFAVIAIIVSVFLYFVRANIGTTIIVFFIYSMATILAIYPDMILFSRKGIKKGYQRTTFHISLDILFEAELNLLLCHSDYSGNNALHTSEI